MALERHDYVVLITDANLVEIGQPITTWTKIEVDRKWNEPKSALVTVPADPALLPVVFYPGRRAVLLRDGAYYCGGPIERPAEPFEWEADTDGEGFGEVTFAFTDDLLSVVSHLTLPDPSRTPEDGSQPAEWVASSTNGEAVMRSLVAQNCISVTGAVAYRKVPALVLGASAGVGSTIGFRTRFEPLGDALRRAALAAGGLGFTTVQTGSTIEFRVFAPVDRTKEVRFSRSVGNLRGIHLEAAAPTCSDAIVGGGGEGADRLIRRRVSTPARTWGLFEQFIDQRDTTDTTELNQAGDEALTEGSEEYELSVVTVVVAGQPVPAVGDLVTVELWPGEELAQVVRSDHLEVDADGELLTLMVGTPNATPDPLWVRRVQSITRSLRKLEAK